MTTAFFVIGAFLCVGSGWHFLNQNNIRAALVALTATALGAAMMWAVM